MKELFDFDALKTFLATGVTLRMDCMHGGTLLLVQFVRCSPIPCLNTLSARLFCRRN